MSFDGAELRLIRSVRLLDLVLIPLLTLGVVGLTSWGLSMALMDHFAPDPVPGYVTQALIFGVLLLQAYVVIVLIRLLVLDKYHLNWEALGLVRVDARRWFPVAVIVALALLGVTVSINLVLSWLLDAGFNNPQQALVDDLSQSWLSLAGLVFVGALVLPLTEELYFRGLLYPWLRGRFNFAWSLAISSLIFAGLHAAWVLIPAIFVVGLALGYLRERSGSIWPGFCCHAVFNAIQLSFMFIAQAMVG